MKGQMRLYNDLSPIVISLSDYALRDSKYICGCCWLLENASHVDSYIKTPSLQSYFEKLYLLFHPKNRFYSYAFPLL